MPLLYPHNVRGWGHCGDILFTPGGHRDSDAKERCGYEGRPKRSRRRVSMPLIRSGPSMTYRQLSAPYSAPAFALPAAAVIEPPAAGYPIAPPRRTSGRADADE